MELWEHVRRHGHETAHQLSQQHSMPKENYIEYIQRDHYHYVLLNL
jgi:hypothetical protein